jgi:hypothetical protein
MLTAPGKNMRCARCRTRASLQRMRHQVVLVVVSYRAAQWSDKADLTVLLRSSVNVRMNVRKKEVRSASNI